MVYKPAVKEEPAAKGKCAAKWKAAAKGKPPATGGPEAEGKPVAKAERRRLLKASRDSIEQYSQWILCPLYSAFPDLPLDEEAWDASQRSPNMSSMYDDIVRLYRTGQYEMLRIPELCRRIVLWSWRAQVNLSAKLVKEVVVDLLLNAASSPQSTDRTAWRLVQAKLQIQSLEESIQFNMNVLGIGGPRSIAEAWEAEDWKSLENTIATVGRGIDVVYEFQTQRAGIQGTTSVKNLTSVAILFAPVSVIAGIFAMGGEFAAGDKRFWVFWAVSIPLMSVLSLILFTPLQSALKYLFTAIFHLVLRNMKKGRKPDEEQALKGESEAE
jgi:hypothetical protein